MMLEYVRGTLERNGEYARVATPLVVAGHEFVFDLAFVGPADHGNLVIVVADDGTASSDVARGVRSLILTLGRTHSSRPVTVVCIASADGSDAAAIIAAFAHVIRVPAAGPTSEVDRLLKPLLKLTLPTPTMPESFDEVFREVLGKKVADPTVKSLLRAARKGPDEVKAALLCLIDEAIGDDVLEVPCD